MQHPPKVPGTASQARRKTKPIRPQVKKASARHKQLGTTIARQHAGARRILSREDPPFGVAFLGSARTKPGQVYYDKNIEAAAAVAALGYPIVHGGGPGQMEASARGARRVKNALSIALGLRLTRVEQVSAEHDISIWFDDFSPRIDTFRHLGRVAMVFFPGGIGSLHESMSVIDNIMQKKAPPRTIIFFEPEPEKPYWTGFFAWLKDTVMARGMLKEAEISFVQIAHSTEELVKIIKTSAGAK